jgi:hypothetical protein
MFRTISAAALALTFLSMPAFAAMDCEKEYRVRVDHMMEKFSVQFPIKDMVHLTRFTLMGYDNCMKGNMKMAHKYFDEAMKYGN